MRALVAVVWMLAAIGGCNGGDATSPDTAPLRTEVVWQLETWSPNSGPAIQVSDPSLYTVRFHANGTVDVRADCNGCGGGARVDGASLTIGPLACTLIACPLPTLGDEFTAALTRVTSYVQTPADLVLIYGGGTLRFRAGP